MRRAARTLVRGEARTLEVDSVVVCAGQAPRRGLADELRAAGRPVHVIGGAADATGLDAERAVREGMETALRL